MFVTRLFVGKKYIEMMRDGVSQDKIDDSIRVRDVDCVARDYTASIYQSYVGYTIAKDKDIPAKLDPIIEGAIENFKDAFGVTPEVILIETVK